MLEMKYFVLKPAGVGSYADASRRAMIAYAKSIGPVDQELSDQLLVWVENEIKINLQRRKKGL